MKPAVRRYGLMPPSPKVVALFKEFNWPHLPTNEGVLEELEERLWKAASSSRGNPLVYSEWVGNLAFVVPQYFGGEKFSMSVGDWLPQYSHIIGDILGWLNAKSYEEHGVLISSMAVSKGDNQPGDRFYGLSSDVGLFNGKTEMQKLKFWTEQIELVKRVARTRQVPNGPDLESFLIFIREGESAVKDVPTRTRCAALAAAAREAHRLPNGILECIVCKWAKPVGPIKGDIVQMHHLKPLSGLPKKGIVVQLSDAKKLFIPLCPTCHALAHAKEGGGEFTQEELMKLRKGQVAA
ncbi:hypothetical protein [Prosthecobacter sp.]|uniref:hypothetical protein n=1 Tax=Prosthecobacter sp. TaxID=1965333 RepID=UPI003BAEDAC9